MYTDAVMPSRLTQFAQEAQRRLGVILALSLVFVGVAIIAPTDMARNVLLASGATLLLLCGALQTVLWLFQRR